MDDKYISGLNKMLNKEAAPYKLKHNVIYDKDNDQLIKRVKSKEDLAVFFDKDKPFVEAIYRNFWNLGFEVYVGGSVLGNLVNKGVKSYNDIDLIVTGGERNIYGMCKNLRNLSEKDRHLFLPNALFTVSPINENYYMNALIPERFNLTPKLSKNKTVDGIAKKFSPVANIDMSLISQEGFNRYFGKK